MEIQRTSIGDITYNGKTFKNITNQLRLEKAPDGFTWTPPEPQGKVPDGYMRATEDSCLWVLGSPEKLRAKASREAYRATGAYGDNTAMTAAATAINQERDEAISKFLDGDMSQEELADTFERLLNQFRNACNENDYPSPLGLTLYEDEGFAEAFYSDFRAQILQQAVQRNDNEGKQYITGEMDIKRNWKYYNSDYYYISEDALAALNKGLEQFLDHVAIKDYKVDIPDYKAARMDKHYNFNSSWSAYEGMCSWYGEADQFMNDFDAVPPKRFEWFYQSGGDMDRDVLYLDSTISTHVPFDAMDSWSAATWAAYRDSNGMRHFVSTDFAYDYSEDDLKVVSNLLKFTGNRNEDAAINRFMDSLQVCKRGYFYRNNLIRGIDLWG